MHRITIYFVKMCKEKRRLTRDFNNFCSYNFPVISSLYCYCKLCIDKYMGDIVYRYIMLPACTPSSAEVACTS